MNTTMAKVSVEKVDHDDMGDTHWQYHATVTVKDIVIFDEYYHECPDELEVLASAREYVEGQL